jgi:UDP-N-acetylmuramate--alanine ligase
LFPEFVSAFAEADEVVMIDIFSSAREKYDETVSSPMLCQAITTQFPAIRAQNFESLPSLADYLKSSLKPGDVLITVGAGDMYQVHDLL